MLSSLRVSQRFIERYLPAGTAILSKCKPLSVDKTLPGHPDPGLVKGRIITLEFEDYYVIGTYVVNGGQALKVRSFVLSRHHTIHHIMFNGFSFRPSMRKSYGTIISRHIFATWTRRNL